MTRATTWGVRAAVLLTIAWPLVGEAGTVALPGSSWSLSGKTRVSGVFHAGRRSRSFRDGTNAQVNAGFGALAFDAHDLAGWDYSGMYLQRGRNGATVQLTFDARSETEFDVMLSSWLSSLAGEAVTADGRSTPMTAVIRNGKATLTGTRRFSATSGSGSARGTWTIRASGRQN